jgi:23S rRNA (adenine2030-N6)-methyltransferase
VHYRHSFHAGNFADVFKHALLCGLLGALSRKDTPWFYLETHAGAGRYDLGDEPAGRTAEYLDGIAKLWDLTHLPSLPAEYLRIARTQNPDGKLRHSPGSPLIALACARPQDRLVFCEKVPEVAEQLRIALARDPRCAVHLRDGYEAHALLPPVEKRGLVLIDPAFESREEFAAISEFIGKSLARFAHGIYAVWYPLKNRHEAERFARRCEREFKRPALNCVFENGAHAEGQMHACGLLVLNPPYGFEAQARETLAFLATRLAQGRKPAWSVTSLSGDRG